MGEEVSKATVLICTRNRGDSVVATIESVLANTHPDFEVILVDQSSNKDTEEAIGRFRNESRFRYIQSTTQGKSHALNLGLEAAKGDVVALTDDDCTVPPNWLDVMTRIFRLYPRVAVAFCNVIPAPHDASAGFIPAYTRENNKLVRTMWQKLDARGIGAGMAVRRDAMVAMGGFDQCLGPGSRFLSCDDRDVPARALLRNLWVYETREVAVVHDGFRNWEQGKELSRRNWFGLGAAYAKTVKCGYLQVIPVIIYEALIMALKDPLCDILHFNKPRGIGRTLHFAQGFIRGLRTPVDCCQIKYRAS